MSNHHYHQRHVHRDEIEVGAANDAMDAMEATQ